MKKQADILILGGGLGGLMAARAAEKRGLTVAMVERSGALGEELTQTKRGILKAGPFGYSLPILEGALRKQLLAERLSAGQEPLFFCEAAGRLIAGGRAVGALVGNSFGLHTLYARTVIDAQAVYSDALSPKECVYSFGVDGAAPYLQPTYAVPAAFGEKVCVTDAWEPGRRILTFRSAWDTDENVRLRALDLFTWFKENREEFRDATFSHMAEVIVRRRDPLFAEDCAGWTSVRLQVTPDFTREDLDREAARIDAVVEKAAAALPDAAERFEKVILPDGTEIPRAACTVTACADEGLPFVMDDVTFDGALVKRRVSRRALVVGGGTSGYQAFAALCAEGADPMLIEANAVIGGTSTFGLVHTNWHGYCAGRNRVWEAQKAALREKGVLDDTFCGALAEYQTVQGHLYLPLTIVCATQMREHTVTGVLAVDEKGLFAADADITVDATGEAVVPYLAGLPCSFGYAATGMTQTYSQWGVEYWPYDSYLNRRYHGDPDVLLQSYYSEMLRGTYLAHIDNSDLQIAPFVTVREGRRFHGEYTLSMRDIYCEITPDDVITVTLTPFDSHGMSENIFGLMGICRCNHTEELRARIPYRCYLAKDTEGLLVTGKAFSGSRDAVNVCRMNPDLRNAGYAVGLAAGMALRAGCGLRQIDMKVLQKKLFALEILPTWVKDPQPQVDWTLPAGVTFNMARAMFADRTTAMEKTENLHTPEAAAVRAWFGDDTALDAAVQTLTGGKGLSFSQVGDDAIQFGVTANVGERDALALLGKAARKKDIPVLAEYVKTLHTGGKIGHKADIYCRSRWDGYRFPNSALIESALFACRRLADPALIPGLEALLDEMGELECPERLAPVTAVFPAYQKLECAEALFLCGSQKGKEALQRFAQDGRYLLRKNAQRALAGEQDTDEVPPEVRALY